MVGHKTESIYRRYAIVDEAIHREAASKLDTWNIEQQAKAEAARKRQFSASRSDRRGNQSPTRAQRSMVGPTIHTAAKPNSTFGASKRFK